MQSHLLLKTSDSNAYNKRVELTLYDTRGRYRFVDDNAIFTYLRSQCRSHRAIPFSRELFGKTLQSLATNEMFLRSNSKTKKVKGITTSSQTVGQQGYGHTVFRGGEQARQELTARTSDSV